MEPEGTGERGREEPILRVEAGTHTSSSSDAALSVDERLLLTVSQDKTARLWSVPELRPLGVLRPPIGLGPDEGRLFVAALSPDSTLAAVGGWSAGPSYSFYVFDVARRAIVQRLDGLDATVNRLCFSPDGERLAAGLWAGAIRVWRTADWTFLAEDREHEDQVYGLDFAIDGRLVASSLNGVMRLYDRELRPVISVEAPSGTRPFELRFSPDGGALAVGYENGLPEVRDGRSLTLIASPNVDGLGGRQLFLSDVAWSADGDVLYAGGAYHYFGRRCAWTTEMGFPWPSLRDS